MEIGGRLEFGVQRGRGWVEAKESVGVRNFVFVLCILPGAWGVRYLGRISDIAIFTTP